MLKPKVGQTFSAAAIWVLQPAGSLLCTQPEWIWATLHPCLCSSGTPSSPPSCTYSQHCCGPHEHWQGMHLECVCQYLTVLRPVHTRPFNHPHCTSVDLIKIALHDSSTCCQTRTGDATYMSPCSAPMYTPTRIVLLASRGGTVLHQMDLSGCPCSR